MIKVKYGKLIDPFFRKASQADFPDYELYSIEETKKKIPRWQEIANPVPKRLEFITGLEFKEPITCYIVSASRRDMSDPLIIKGRLSDEEFHITLVHELLHILYRQHNVPFPTNFEPNTGCHIPIFKTMIAYFGREVCEKEYNKSKDPVYKKAWEEALK